VKQQVRARWLSKVEATEWLPDTITWYEKLHLPLGYVGLVRCVRTKDHNRQPACGQERK
jgi:hypothetical protein